MPPPPRHTIPAIARIAAWLLASALLLALAACGSLPPPGERPFSHAPTNTSDTPLARLIEQQRTAGTKPALAGSSGFVLLSGPQHAYGARLALIENASRTLDLQYYAIHADASTERLMAGLVSAARRGVRVRVLVDDYHSAGRDAQVMRLAFVPNIEMRMFNPVTGPRGWALGRLASVLWDFERAQKRMHNKLFIADNQMAIAGGRNLGDAYFGHSDAGNFVDLDVLAAGPVVQDLSHSFDSYWNHALAYPVQSLISQRELETLRESQRISGAGAPTPSAARPPPPAPNTSDIEKRVAVWNQQALSLHRLPWVWAAAAVLTDHPAKIPSEGAGAPGNGSEPATQPPPSPSPTAQVQKLSAPRKGTDIPQRALPAGNGNNGNNGEDDSVVDGLLQLMAAARRDVLIVSPYFVPGPEITQAFARAKERGVRVRVLTNSLASNDAPIAHAGYARHRETLLRMGVELHEMRSEQAGVRSALSTTVGGSGSSRAMLHSKLIVVDGRLLAVGSMNLDLRSQKHNTEIALLIRSLDLAGLAVNHLDAALRESAWRVELDTNNALVWRSPPGSTEPDARTEPDASAPLRLLLNLLGPLAPDHLL